MQGIIAKLTAKDDKYACAIADKIISESQDTDEWYEYFDAFASLLNHPKSLVRNRVLYILAANAQWDDENRFDAILPEFLSHTWRGVCTLCLQRKNQLPNSCCHSIRNLKKLGVGKVAVPRYGKTGLMIILQKDNALLRQ